MDPDALLKRLLEVANDEDNRDPIDDDALRDALEELSRGIQDLDRWLHAGGFLPARWNLDR